MYIYEALSHVTPHSICRTLQRERGVGVDRNLGAVISRSSCCSEPGSVDDSKLAPTADVRSNIAAPTADGVKDPYIRA